jgi:hypothetical protein
MSEMAMQLALSLAHSSQYDEWQNPCSEQFQQETVLYEK